MSATESIFSNHVPPPCGRGSIIQILCNSSERLKDKIAFRFLRERGLGVVEVTYQGLFERAKVVAAELQSRVAVGERALLAYPPGLEFLEGFFGCLMAGIVAVPVALPKRRRATSQLAEIFRSAKPRLVLCSSVNRRELENVASFQGMVAPEHLLETDALEAGEGADWKVPETTQDDIAFMQYTSGSTSAPKGVIVSHRNLLANLSMIQESLGTNENTIGVSWLPLYHDMGLIGGVLQPFYCGGTSTLLAPAAFLQRPALWLETISQTRATISGGPDFGYDLCVRKVTEEQRRSLDLDSWSIAFTGAERIRSGTLARFEERFRDNRFRRDRFFSCYGLAEATLMVSGGPAGRSPMVLSVSVDRLAANQVQLVEASEVNSLTLVGSGRILPGQDVVLIDPKSGELCPSDRVGEIWIRGENVTQGYFEQPAETARTFSAHLPSGVDRPFLRTGDLGFLWDEQLFITGRLKDLLIIRGRNLYPEDIEQTLSGIHPSLRPGGCVAFAVDDGECERLHLIVEVDARCDRIEAEEVFHVSRREIAAQLDVEVDTIGLARAGSIPRTTSGKPRRAACRELFLNRKVELVAVWRAERGGGAEQNAFDDHTGAARTFTARETEEWLVLEIAGRLDLSPSEVEVSTPFLEFGMSSLDAVELTGRLEVFLKRRLSPTMIYNYPNVSALASWLAGPQSPPPLCRAQSTWIAGVPREESEVLAEIRGLSDEELAVLIQEEMSRAGQSTNES